VLEAKGPFKNFDFIFCFLKINIPELSLKFKFELSSWLLINLVLTIQALTISPFKVYLYLKPLYSNLGGSTTREELFIKKLEVVFLRLNPLYK
jgi:hypothetical protein